MPPPLDPIPDPPRSVRGSACIVRHWIAGASGIVSLTAAASLAITAIVAAGALPFRDIMLDAGTRSTVGTVEACTAEDHALAGPLWRLQYRFTWQGTRHRGTSFARRAPSTPALLPEEECAVEFLARRPEISRVEDTRNAVYPDWVALSTSGLTLLGVLGVYRWGRAALRLRIGLREGRQTSAQLIEVLDSTPWLGALRIRYRFFDHQGEEHITGHWTRSRSALGAWLRDERPRTVPVIHDAHNAAVNRLVAGGECFRSA